jgi:GNAT superfamily N-acetyltransferase
MIQDVKIEKVNKNNFNDFLYLLEKLAKYEKVDPPNNSAKLRLKTDFLSDNKCEAYLFRINDKTVAYTIFFMTYSSYLALPTLYIEDLFVLEEFRRKGIGKKMFKFCIKKAKEKNCGRIEWTVYNWNKSAIEFYEHLGAICLEKKYYRLNRNKIEAISSNIEKNYFSFR